MNMIMTIISCLNNTDSTGFKHKNQSNIMLPKIAFTFSATKPTHTKNIKLPFSLHNRTNQPIGFWRPMTYSSCAGVNMLCSRW